MEHPQDLGSVCPAHSCTTCWPGPAPPLWYSLLPPKQILFSHFPTMLPKLIENLLFTITQLDYAVTETLLLA